MMMSTKFVAVIFCVVSFSASAMDNHPRGSGSENSVMGKSTIINIGTGNVHVAEADLTVNHSSRMDNIIKLVATSVVWPILIGIGSFGYQRIRENRQNGNGVTTRYIVHDLTLGRLCRSMLLLFETTATRIFPWPSCPSNYVFVHEYTHCAMSEPKTAYQSPITFTTASTISEDTQPSMSPEEYAAYAAAINQEMSGQPEPSAPPADDGSMQPLPPLKNPTFTQMLRPIPEALRTAHKQWQITTFRSNGAGTARLTFNPDQSEGAVSKGRILQKIKEGHGNTYEYNGANDIVVNLPGVREVRLTYAGTIVVDGIGEPHGKDLYDFSVVHSGAGTLSVNPNHRNLFVKTLTVKNGYAGCCDVKNLRAEHVMIENSGAGNSYVRPEKSVYGKMSYVGQVHCFVDHLNKEQQEKIDFDIQGRAENLKLHE